MIAYLSSVVFIHGLNGDPRGTWTYKGPRRDPDPVFHGSQQEASSRPTRNEEQPAHVDKMKNVHSVEEVEVTEQGDTQQTQDQGDQLLPTETSAWKYLKTLSSLFWKEKPDAVSPAKISHEDSANKPAAQQYEFFWPQHLPDTCARARVMTFGYDSKALDVFRGTLDQNALYDHAKDLLEALVRKRTNAVCVMISYTCSSYSPVETAGSTHHLRGSLRRRYVVPF